MGRLFKIFVAFLISVVVVTVLGSVASTYFVLERLAALGVEISTQKRVDTILSDIVGIAPLYAPLAGLGLLIAFTAAVAVNRLAPGHRLLVFTVAGAVGVVCTWVIGEQFFWHVQPVGGARTLLGMAAQGGAGAFAGLVFALLVPRRR